jgi:hypothetical protein
VSWTECDFGEPPVGDLTIDDISLFTAAWTLDNLYEWWLPASQRGGDVIRPGVPGVYAVRRFVTVTRRSCRLTVGGMADPDGVPYSNWYEGMFENLRYLGENLVAPTGTGDGTRSAVLTAPNGDLYAGDVHVTGMEVAEMRPNARYARVVIEVSIPGGELQPWSS